MSSDASRPQASTLPSESRAILLARCAAAAAVNRSAELDAALDAALDAGIDVLAVYEILLQNYLFAGFPAALEGLLALAARLGARRVDWWPPEAAEIRVEQFRERGEELCRRIYTSAYQPMRSRLGAVTPDLDRWMIVEGYGKTLSREGLTSVEREIGIVAVLAVLGWQRQLYSHIRGAMNVGAGPGLIRDVIDAVADFMSAVARDTADRTLASVQKSQAAPPSPSCGDASDDALGAGNTSRPHTDTP